MGVLEVHPWGSTIHHVEEPDILIFDLDPAPDVPWKKVVAAAFDVKSQLEKIKIKSFVKTTGGKGLHIVAPIKPVHDWEAIKYFANSLVNYLEMQNPDAYVSKMTKAKRTGKIYVDFLRNQRGATAIAPYSTRARIHAPVSTPLDWDELTSKFEDTFYTLRTLPKRLEKLKKDPWRDFFQTKQSLNLKEPA